MKKIISILKYNIRSSFLTDIIKHIIFFIYVLKNVVFKRDYINGYYDLNRDPISCDFFIFLLFLEAKRQINRKKYISLSLRNSNAVKHDIFRKDLKPLQELSMRFRFFNINMQSLKLFNQISYLNIKNINYTSLPKKQLCNTYNYKVETCEKFLKDNFNSLNDNPLKFENSDKKIFDDWCYRYNAKKSKLITISIRDSARDPQRNSNIADWLKFYDYIVKKEFFPVIIYDFEGTKDNQIFKNLVTCEIASTDYFKRLIFYKYSLLNTFVSQGPATGNLYLDTNYIYSNTNLNHKIGNHEDFLKFKSFDKKNKFRKILENDQRFESLKNAFDEFLVFYNKVN